MKKINLQACFFSCAQAVKAARALHQMGYTYVQVFRNPAINEGSTPKEIFQARQVVFDSREAPSPCLSFFNDHRASEKVLPLDVTLDNREETFLLEVAIPDRGEDAERTAQTLLDLGGVV